MFHLTTRTITIITLAIFFKLTKLNAQKVVNTECPTSYFRNNGNGQVVTTFAATITEESIYFQQALNTGNQGTFRFIWDTEILYPPVINKTWTTSTEGIIDQNWTFGDNATGTPFNPPSVPENFQVQYTFYNENLPTAGSVTIEFIDPFDGSFVNTCSYPLSKGGSTEGGKIDQAISSPTDFYYTEDTTYSPSGSNGNSVEPKVNSGGGSVSYSTNQTYEGITLDITTGVIYWDNTVIQGTYDLEVTATNGLDPDVSTNFTLIIEESTGVSSGNEGGLESESLGGAIAERFYDKKTHDTPSKIRYKKEIDFSKNINRRLNKGIEQFLPDAKNLGNSFKAYVTSPTDITTFTNANNVVSVDYVSNGSNRAVAFCTETNDGIYTHTKPVCDRLKGSELENLKIVNINGFKLLQYQLKPALNTREYAVSFSISINETDDHYSLQSEWLTSAYIAHTKMYNFQIWTSNPLYLEKLVKSVLSKFTRNKPIVQIGDCYKTNIFISKVVRDKKDQRNVIVSIKNNSAATEGVLVVKGKENEQSMFEHNSSFKIKLDAFQENHITISIDDIAEAEIELLINEKREDFIYCNDGIWNVFQSSSTDIQEFTISNDDIEPTTEEYRLFRNIKLTATTEDYVTVYRMIKGSGVKANFSDFNSLKFNASGNGKLRIRLIKESITDFENQYEYLLNLSPSSNEYSVDFEDFFSTNGQEPATFEDVTIVSFTYEYSSGRTNKVETTLNNVRFSKEKSIKPISIEEAVIVYPNPFTTSFNCQFAAVKEETMKLTIICASTGKTELIQRVDATQGLNEFNINIRQELTQGAYLLSIESIHQTFPVKKLMIYIK